jgi:hypothetical protein
LWESIAVLDRVLDEIGDLEVGGRVGMLSVYSSALLAAAGATGDDGRLDRVVDRFWTAAAVDDVTESAGALDDLSEALRERSATRSSGRERTLTRPRR